MMDTNWSNPDVVNAYRKQKEHAAEANRQKIEQRRAKKENAGVEEDTDNTNPLAPALAVVGKKMVQMGMKLQARYGELKVENASQPQYVISSQK